MFNVFFLYNNHYFNKKKYISFRFFKILKTLPLYPPSEETKISKNMNFTLKSLREIDNEIIQTYVESPKLHKDNIDLVYKTLLEIEDITCMSEYPPLAQEDVILNATSIQGQYWIQVRFFQNLFVIFKSYLKLYFSYKTVLTLMILLRPIWMKWF